MNSLSTATRLRRMGIFDIIVALFLVFMGEILLNVEIHAKNGGSNSIIQAIVYLIVLGVALLILGILLIVSAFRPASAAGIAAKTCAWTITVGSISFALFRWIAKSKLAFFGLLGILVGTPALEFLKSLNKTDME